MPARRLDRRPASFEVLRPTAPEIQVHAAIAATTHQVALELQERRAALLRAALGLEPDEYEAVMASARQVVWEVEERQVVMVRDALGLEPEEYEALMAFVPCRACAACTRGAQCEEFLRDPHIHDWLARNRDARIRLTRPPAAERHRIRARYRPLRMLDEISADEYEALSLGRSNLGNRSALLVGRSRYARPASGSTAPQTLPEELDDRLRHLRWCIEHGTGEELCVAVEEIRHWHHWLTTPSEPIHPDPMPVEAEFICDDLARAGGKHLTADVLEAGGRAGFSFKRMRTGREWLEARGRMRSSGGGRGRPGYWELTG